MFVLGLLRRGFGGGVPHDEKEMLFLLAAYTAVGISAEPLNYSKTVSNGNCATGAAELNPH